MDLIKCHVSNYKAGRSAKIQYIVIHYTANNGDTARGNGSYFSRTANIKASAHYFCDEREVCQSVADSDTAYHVGANTYRHKLCRNGNSIGIEMCSKKDTNGKYYIPDATIKNALELTRQKMKQYNVPLENVLRHYDVTGKSCPEPFVRNPKLWDEFRAKLKGDIKIMTVEQAKQIIKQKAGLSDATIEFLYSYRYGDDLLIKLAEVMK